MTLRLGSAMSVSGPRNYVHFATFAVQKQTGREPPDPAVERPDGSRPTPAARTAVASSRKQPFVRRSKPIDSSPQRRIRTTPLISSATPSKRVRSTDLCASPSQPKWSKATEPSI